MRKAGEKEMDGEERWTDGKDGWTDGKGRRMGRADGWGKETWERQTDGWGRQTNREGRQMDGEGRWVRRTDGQMGKGRWVGKIKGWKMDEEGR